MNTIFCGSCIPKSLLLKYSPMNKVLQVAQRLERTKTGWSMIKNANTGVNRKETGKKGVKEVEINKIGKIWETHGNPKPLRGNGTHPNYIEILRGPFSHNAEYETYMNAAIHVLSFTTSEVLVIIVCCFCFIVIP